MPTERIVDESEMPRPRENNVVVIDYLAPMGDDPDGKKAPAERFVAQRFHELTGGTATLRILETRTEYSGYAGLMALQFDWAVAMGRARTSKARAHSAGPKKVEAPKFYLRLSAAEKRELRKQYESRKIKGAVATVVRIAKEWKTSKASLERVANIYGWSRPGGED